MKQFQMWTENPQSLLYDLAKEVSNYIHDLTLQATIEGAVNPRLYELLASNWWGLRKTDSPTTNLVVVNNEQSAQHKEDIIQALRLSQNDSE